MFTKLILAIAIALTPGADLPWPAHEIVRESAELPEYVGIFPGGHQRQIVCTTKPGVYQVQVRVGMLPLPAGDAEIAGWVMVEAGPETALLTLWRAAPGEWTLAQGSATLALDKNRCVWLTYAASGPAPLNADPRVTSWSVARIGP